MISLDKRAVAQKYGKHGGDTGSARVQVATLTARINGLTEHFRQHPKDVHSRHGLLMMVSRRRRLLNYVKRTDLEDYRQLINQLGLRY